MKPQRIRMNVSAVVVKDGFTELELRAPEDVKGGIFLCRNPPGDVSLLLKKDLEFYDQIYFNGVCIAFLDPQRYIQFHKKISISDIIAKDVARNKHRVGTVTRILFHRGSFLWKKSDEDPSLEISVDLIPLDIELLVGQEIEIADDQAVSVGGSRLGHMTAVDRMVFDCRLISDVLRLGKSDSKPSPEVKQPSDGQDSNSDLIFRNGAAYQGTVTGMKLGPGKKWLILSEPSEDIAISHLEIILEPDSPWEARLLFGHVLRVLGHGDRATVEFNGVEIGGMIPGFVMHFKQNLQLSKVLGGSSTSSSVLSSFSEKLQECGASSLRKSMEKAASQIFTGLNPDPWQLLRQFIMNPRHGLHFRWKETEYGPMLEIRARYEEGGKGLGREALIPLDLLSRSRLDLLAFMTRDVIESVMPPSMLDGAPPIARTDKRPDVFSSEA